MRFSVRSSVWELRTFLKMEGFTVKRMLLFLLTLFSLCLTIPCAFAVSEDAREYVYKPDGYVSIMWIPEDSEVKISIFSGWWKKHDVIQNAVIALYEGDSGKMSDFIVLSKTHFDMLRTLHYSSDSAPLCKIFCLDDSFSPVMPPYEWQTKEVKGVTLKFEGTHVLPNHSFSATQGKFQLQVYKDGKRFSDYIMTSENDSVCSLTPAQDGSIVLTANGEGKSWLTLTIGTDVYQYLWETRHASESEGMTLHWDGNIIQQDGSFGNESGEVQTLYFCKDGVALSTSDFTCFSLDANICSLTTASDYKVLLTPNEGGDSWLLFNYDGVDYRFHWNDNRPVDNTKPRAWYEVENGSLYIRTNIDSSEWENGYSGTIRCSFSDGSRDFDNQGGHGESVSFSVLTLPFQNAGTTVRQIDYVVYDTSSFAYQQFWPQFVELGDYDAFDTAVDACSDHVVARFTLYTPLLVTSSDKSLTLQSFEISYNNTNQTETYTAVLDEPLSDEGEYSVHYRSSSGNQYAGMSAIFKSGNVLTFTRNIHHFADTGSSGFFKIVHAECKKQENGSIICEKAESNWYPYTFE